MAKKKRNRRPKALKKAKARLRKVRQNKPARKPAAQKRRVTKAKTNVQKAQKRTARSVRNVAPRQQAVARAGGFTRTRPSGNTVAIAPAAAVNKSGNLKKGVTYDAGKSINARDKAVIQTSGLNKQAAKALINTRQNATNFGNKFTKSDVNNMQKAGMTRMGIAASVKADPQAAQSKAGKRAIALSEGQFKGSNYDYGDVFNQQDVKNLRRAGMDRQAIAQYVDSQGIKNKVADRFKLKAVTSTIDSTPVPTPGPTPSPTPGPTPGPSPTPPGGSGEEVVSGPDNSPLDDFIGGEYQTTLNELQGLQTANAELKEQLAKYENIQAPNTESGGGLTWNPNKSLYDTYGTNDPSPSPVPSPGPRTPTPSITGPRPPAPSPTGDLPEVTTGHFDPPNPRAYEPGTGPGQQIVPEPYMKPEPDQRRVPEPYMKPEPDQRRVPEPYMKPEPYKIGGDPFQWEKPVVSKPSVYTYKPLGNTNNEASQMFLSNYMYGSSTPTNPFTGQAYDLDADGMPKYSTMTYGPGTTIPGQVTPTGVTPGGFDPSPPAVITPQTPVKPYEPGRGPGEPGEPKPISGPGRGGHYEPEEPRRFTGGGHYEPERPMRGGGEVRRPQPWLPGSNASPEEVARRRRKDREMGIIKVY